MNLSGPWLAPVPTPRPETSIVQSVPLALPLVHEARR